LQAAQNAAESARSGALAEAKAAVADATEMAKELHSNQQALADMTT